MAGAMAVAKSEQSQESAMGLLKDSIDASRNVSLRRKVDAFLEKHGFRGDVNTSKSSWFKSRYPLHVAVKEQDAKMVMLLISAGANKFSKNSSGHTPVEKAWKYFHKQIKEVSSKQKSKDAAWTDFTATKVARLVLEALGEKDGDRFDKALIGNLAESEVRL